MEISLSTVSDFLASLLRIFFFFEHTCLNQIPVANTHIVPQKKYNQGT